MRLRDPESRQEIVARALWADGNNRIGHRPWETVKNAYMAEAGHAIAALRGSGFCIVPACEVSGHEHAYHGRRTIRTGRLWGHAGADEPDGEEFCDGTRLFSRGIGELDDKGRPTEPPSDLIDEEPF